LFDFQKIEILAQRIKKILPEDPRILAEEFKNTSKPLVQSFLKRANLVTREEFDIQSQLLDKAQQQLKELEAVIEKIKSTS
jgi:BMFP domain-containing protein YqiC